jgi:hypothetical protein
MAQATASPLEQPIANTVISLTTPGLYFSLHSVPLINYRLKNGNCKDIENI